MVNLPFWPKKRTIRSKVIHHYPTTGFFKFDSTKVIYCPIPKNSSTFFKARLIKANGDLQAQQESPFPLHAYLRKRSQYWVHDLHLLQDPSYFKFAIVRDPLDRVVSAYLNKFVAARRHHPIQVQSIQAYRDLVDASIDPELSLTFRQFVRLICKQNDADLDKHWRPQKTFLQGQEEFLDWSVPLDRLQDFLPVLEAHLGQTIVRSRPDNSTPYTKSGLAEDVTRLSPRRLRNLRLQPDKEEFLLPELKERLRQRYFQDIELLDRSRERFELKRSHDPLTDLA
jgi:hypothetical protein